MKSIPLNFAIACVFLLAFLSAGLAMTFSRIGTWGYMVSGMLLFAAALVVCKHLDSRLSALQTQLQHFQSTALRRIPIDTAVEVNALLALRERFPRLNIPTSSYSMRFANLLAIVDVLDTNQPKMIVEFGSGISTMVISAWIAERGDAKLLSFEHDQDWAEITIRHLQRNKTHQFAEVKRADLRQRETLNKSFPWYDITPEHMGILEEVKIDLIVVDGPPQGLTNSELGRFPALQVFKNQLSENAIIVLDDANRESEQAVVKQWQKLLPSYSASFVHSVTGLCILQKDDDLQELKQ